MQSDGDREVLIEWKRGEKRAFNEAVWQFVEAH